MWHILALVLAVGSVFLIYFLVQLLKQLKDMLKTVENTLAQLEKEIYPVINNVEGITDNVEHMTGRADSIFETVQTKTVDTMSAVDNLKGSLDIIKHTLFLLINHLSRYSKAFGIGFKVGVGHYMKSREVIASTAESNTTLLTPPASVIIDHLEIKSG